MAGFACLSDRRCGGATAERPRLLLYRHCTVRVSSGQLADGSCARALKKQDIRAWLHWHRALSPRSCPRTTSSRTASGTIWSAAIPSLVSRWPRYFTSRGFATSSICHLRPRSRVHSLRRHFTGSFAASSTGRNQLCHRQGNRDGRRVASQPGVVAFLRILDQSHPDRVIIPVIPDNHSAHVSKETREYPGSVSNGFEFVFTPKHGSWLNLIGAFFAKMTKSMLRGIRVTSAQNLKDRILRYVD